MNQIDRTHLAAQRNSRFVKFFSSCYERYKNVDSDNSNDENIFARLPRVSQRINGEKLFIGKYTGEIRSGGRRASYAAGS